MEDLKALREKKAKLVADERSYLDQIESEKRSTSDPEVKAKLDQFENEFQLCERKIRNAEQDEELRRTDAEKQYEGRKSASKEDEENRELAVYDKFLRKGLGGLNAEERSFIEQRAQSVGTNTAGGYTVPRGFSGEIDQALKAYGGVLEAGRFYNTESGNTVDWPTVDDTANSGYMLSENSDAASGATDFTFGQKTLSAYTFTSGLVKVSNQLLEDSAFNLNSFMVEAFGIRLGRAENTYLTTGTGSSQPQGVVTGSAAGKTAASASAITFDELIDLQHSVDPLYRRNGLWMFNDNTLKAIRKLKDSENRYIWQQGDVRTGAPDTLLGKQYIINQDMADIATTAKTVLFGDFQKFIIRRVGQIIVRRLSERFADYNQTAFVAFQRIDGRLLNSAAVKHLVQA